MCVTAILAGLSLAAQVKQQRDANKAADEAAAQAQIAANKAAAQAQEEARGAALAAQAEAERRAAEAAAAATLDNQPEQKVEVQLGTAAPAASPVRRRATAIKLNTDSAGGAGSLRV